MPQPSTERVAFRYLRAARTTRVTSGKRDDYVNDVWAMYQRTYAPIGMPISSPGGLMKYGIWDVEVVEGHPVAFTLYKNTRFGLKSGASGHDGSSEGKAAAVRNLRSKFKQPGVYGEVSHKVKDIVLASGAQVVCSSLADDVLGKPVTPVGAVEYRRNLQGVGVVQKVMVGQPRGVPTTTYSQPNCPTDEMVRLAGCEDDGDFCDLDAHYACLTA